MAVHAAGGSLPPLAQVRKLALAAGAPKHSYRVISGLCGVALKSLIHRMQCLSPYSLGRSPLGKGVPGVFRIPCRRSQPITMHHVP